VAASAVAAAVVTNSGVASGAQQGSLSFDAGASYSLPPAGGLGEATEYLHGGLRLSGTFGDLSYAHIGGYGGLALRDTGSSWASLLAGLGMFSAVAPAVTLGVILTGEAFTVGAPFPYRAATLRAEPELRLGSGGTSVRARGYGGVGSSEVTVFRSFYRDTRSGPVLVQVGFDVQTDLWTWGGGLDFRHQLNRVAPWIGVEAYETPQGTYAAGRVGVDVWIASALLTLEGALWNTPEGDEPVLFLALQVPAGGTSRIYATAGRYGPDPLLDTPAAGSAGVSITWDVARFGPTPELQYELRESGQQAVLEMSLRAPGAAAAAVTGDFTNWLEVPMRREGEEWVVTLRVDPGAHHFGFIIDGSWYVPLEAPGRAADEWGEVHATLIVPVPAMDGKM
jgi:hypothetical protein